MILSQTPLRISFVGGGSDLPAFYREHEGAVLSTTIDRYVYVAVNRKFDQNIRVSYSKTENVATVSEIEHPLVRECLNHEAVESGIEITSVADIPSKGSGLGSSSAFTVGLLNALGKHRGYMRSPEYLSSQSFLIESERCGEPCGKQDHYAATFGGLNLIRFFPHGGVAVERLDCTKDIIDTLTRRLMLFYTGTTRRSDTILCAKQRNIKSDKLTTGKVMSMVSLAFQMRKELEAGNLSNFGAMLNENWRRKKELADDVSNATVDRWIEAGLACGAEGGKLLGAGGGGFILFYANEDNQSAINNALRPLRRVFFEFDPEGSRIVYNSK